ncbi:MAG: VOC family protein [Rikenellaceae bacterium]|nr:VOC family protein [Rikenellaceae bacterium]MCL2692361.1 VOC family protein [Rikenellaceae bacterium]
MKITSYLIFNGQAEEAANFYADAFGGKIENLYRYESMPPMPDMPEVPAEFKQKIMHACITFPGGGMSVADTLPADPRSFGDGCMLTVSCDSIAQAEGVYDKLCKGAKKITCELGETFFAKRYAELVDRYGVLWAVMYEEEGSAC